MRARSDLFLYEQIFLLALKDEKGTIASGAMYNFAVGGAVFSELLMTNRVAITGEGKKARVESIRREPIDDPLLDEWITKIAERKKLRSMKDWVGRIANSKNLKHGIAQQLCRKGVLRMDEDKVLGIFTRKIYPEVDPRPERILIEQLEGAIFSDDTEVDARTAVLCALAHHANILKVVFDKKRLKERKDRIKQIANGDLTAKATKEAIEAMQAAVMVAVILPSIVATTAAH